MNKQLYVIGNGFDIHHDLDTKYSSFGKYLYEENEELYELVIQYIGFPDTDDDLWYRFEENLANLEYDSLLSSKTNYLPNYGSDDFRDRDRYDFEYAIKDQHDKLTTELREEFRNFILAAEIPDNAAETKIELNKEATFLNFNYTDTLQKLYHVDEKNITFIHNRASDNTVELILGHGILPGNLARKEPQPPENATEEELYEWKEEMANNYDHSFDLGEKTLQQYYFNSFKDSAKNIEAHKAFFESLTSIEEITVMGHSISQVDIKYFEVLHQKVPTCKWSVSYFTDGDKERINDTFQQLGVDLSRIKLFKIADKCLNNIQAKLPLD